MRPFFTLRHRLADIYHSETDQLRLGRDTLDLTDVNLKGSPLASWAALLEAARKQRKLSELFELIAAENPDLSSLLDEVERDPQIVDGSLAYLIDLPPFQLDESEERELSSRFASTVNGLQQEVTKFVLSNSPLEAQGADDVFMGRRTTEAKAAADRYRGESASHELELIRQKDRLASMAQENRLQIQQIQSQPRPSAPWKPREPIRTPFESDAEYQRTAQEYTRSLDEYRSDVAKYQLRLAEYSETQSQLLALKAKLEELELDVERATQEIMAFRLGQAPILAEQEDRIRTARSLDMAQCVEEVLAQSKSFLSPAHGSGLEGLTWFLLAAALDQRFHQVPGVSFALADAFEKSEEAVKTFLASRLEEVARPWMAAVDSLVRTLTTNKKHLGQIDALLDGVPAEELGRALERTHGLESVLLPKLPEIRKLLAPADLEQAERERLLQSERLSAHLADLENELGDETGRRLTEQVVAARGAAEQELAVLRQNAEVTRPVAHGLEVMLGLVSRAKPVMGPWVMSLCDSIGLETESKAGVFAEELLEAAVARSFWSIDAAKRIEDHRTKRYLDGRDALQVKRQETEGAAQKFEKAAEDIQAQPARQRDRFLKTFWWCAAATPIPLGNLVASAIQRMNINRLREVLGSTVPAYVDLATRGRRIAEGILLASAILALGSVAIFCWGKRWAPPETNPRLAVEALVIVYSLNASLAALNLIRWLSFVRRGGRSTS